MMRRLSWSWAARNTVPISNVCVVAAIGLTLTESRIGIDIAHLLCGFAMGLIVQTSVFRRSIREDYDA